MYCRVKAYNLTLQPKIQVAVLFVMFKITTMVVQVEEGASSGIPRGNKFLTAVALKYVVKELTSIQKEEENTKFDIHSLS